MYSNVMKMPSTFSDLSVDEMEYDGAGLFSFIKRAAQVIKAVSVTLLGVAIGCAVVGLATIATGGAAGFFIGAGVALAAHAGTGLASNTY